MQHENTKRLVMVGTYLPPAVHAELKRIAKAERRSLASLLAILIEKGVAKRRGRAA